MKDIIQRILELDRIEQKLTAEAEQIKQETESTISKTKADLRNDYLQRARNRVQLNAAGEREEIKKIWAQLDEDGNQKAQQIGKLFAEHSDQWIDDIVDNIINQVGQRRVAADNSRTHVCEN